MIIGLHYMSIKMSTKHACTLMRTLAENHNIKSSINCWGSIRSMHQTEDVQTVPKRNPFKNSGSKIKKEMFNSVLERFDFPASVTKEFPILKTYHPVTLENRGLLLKEGGFQSVTPYMLSRYLPIVKKKISLLKLYGYIPSGTNVSDSFLHHLGNPPVESFVYDDSCTFIEVYNTVLKQYLTWRLDTTLSELEIVIKRYKRLKHKSLKYIVQALDIIENDLKFSKEKILKHGYLIHCHPHNIQEMLKRIPVLCGVDFRHILQQYPKILLSNADAVLAIASYLKKSGIPDSSVQLCWHIFTLNLDNVKQRLETIQTMPELRPLMNNPRVLRLVHHQNKIRTRLDQLQDLHIRCASLHMLSSPETVFEKFMREGENRSRGYDTVKFLATELKYPESNLRKVLLRHPYWNNVPLMNIQKTLEALLEYGFSAQDIVANIHIVLYNSDLIKQHLTSISENEEVKSSQKILNNLNQMPQHLSSYLDNKKKLAMCLYFMERPHHFTGNGIWNTS